MKKITFLFVTVFAFFFSMNMAFATTLNRTSNKSGEVALSLSIEDGYVGAFDATIQLTGDVTFVGIEWDKAVSSSYVKEYTYDKENNTVRLYVATGNTETKKDFTNLVNQKGILPIGTIKVSAEKDNTRYNVSMNSITVVDMDYKSTTRNKITLDEDKEFLYLKNADSNTNSNSNTNTNSNATSNSNTNHSSSSNSTSSNTNSNTSTNLNTNTNGTTNSNSNSNQISSNSSSNTSSNEVIDSNSNSKKEDKEEKKSFNIWIVVAIVGVILAIGVGCFLFAKKSKEENVVKSNTNVNSKK